MRGRVLVTLVDGLRHHLEHCAQHLSVHVVVRNVPAEPALPLLRAGGDQAEQGLVVLPRQLQPRLGGNLTTLNVRVLVVRNRLPDLRALVPDVVNPLKIGRHGQRAASCVREKRGRGCETERKQNTQKQITEQKTEESTEQNRSQSREQNKEQRTEQNAEQRTE